MNNSKEMSQGVCLIIGVKDNSKALLYYYFIIKFYPLKCFCHQIRERENWTLSLSHYYSRANEPKAKGNRQIKLPGRGSAGKAVIARLLNAHYCIRVA